MALLHDPLVAAAQISSALKMAGCDLIVCISHNGDIYDQLVLSNLPAVDVIIGGHSHNLTQARKVKNTILTQAGEFGRYLGELKVTVETGPTPKVTMVSHTFHSIDKQVHNDPALLHQMNVLRCGINQDPRFGPGFSKFVAKAEKDLDKYWRPTSPQRDTAMGNLVTDAIMKKMKQQAYTVDCVLEATGYLGNKLYAGKVTRNDLVRCLPYGYDRQTGKGFKIKLARLAGLQIIGGLEYSVAQLEYTRDLAMQMSGMSFAYDSAKAPNSRVDMASVKIGGKPIDPQKLYWVALNEQLFNLLNGLGMKPYASVNTDLFEIDIVQEYMHDLKHVSYAAEGRIIDLAVK